MCMVHICLLALNEGTSWVKPHLPLHGNLLRKKHSTDIKSLEGEDDFGLKYANQL